MDDVWKFKEQINSDDLENKRAQLQNSDIKNFNFEINDEIIANSALVIKDLTKKFGTQYAVNHISFAVPKGSFYGLVGPNGAGKTTTISMVAKLLTKSAGKIYINGIDIDADSDVTNFIGVMPDGMRLFDRLTGLELLTYNGLLRGMSKEETIVRAKELLKILDLDREDTKIVSNYSAGMTKKITLACAMIHAPKLLILDEPFEAVDPVSVSKIKKLLNQYVNNGGTIILSSHVMALVEQLCTHVAVMNKGKIVAAGAVEEVASGSSLEDKFIELVGSNVEVEELGWL